MSSMTSRSRRPPRRGSPGAARPNGPARRPRSRSWRLPDAVRLVVAVLGVDRRPVTSAGGGGSGSCSSHGRDHGKWAVRELLHHLGQYYVPYSTKDRLLTPDRRGRTDRRRLASAAGLPQDRKTVAGQRGGPRFRHRHVGRPELLFLDEPTAVVRPARKARIPRADPGFSAREETTILLRPTTSMRRRICHAHPHPRRGRIVADGTANSLAHRSRRRRRCAGAATASISPGAWKTRLPSSGLFAELAKRSATSKCAAPALDTYWPWSSNTKPAEPIRQPAHSTEPAHEPCSLCGAARPRPRLEGIPPALKSTRRDGFQCLLRGGVRGRPCL